MAGFFDTKKGLILGIIIYLALIPLGLLFLTGPDRSNSRYGSYPEKTFGLLLIIGGIYGLVTMMREIISGKYRNMKTESIQSKLNAVKTKKSLTPRIVIMVLSGLIGYIFIRTTIPELIKIFWYAIKPDGIHLVQFSSLNNMPITSSGTEETGITYWVSLDYVGLIFLIAIVLCVCFIISLISLRKAIRINKDLEKSSILKNTNIDTVKNKNDK
jgi:hypothetical protein